MNASSEIAASNSLESRCGLLVQRIEGFKGEQLANEAIIDSATLSRFVNGKVGGGLSLAQFERLLTATRLKMVDEKRTTVLRDELAMLRRVYALVVQHAPELLEERDT